MKLFVFITDLTVWTYKSSIEVEKQSSTMNPETRTLLRVTMEDAIEANETFVRLMGDNPELRREFIEQNAKLVTDLDI